MKKLAAYGKVKARKLNMIYCSKELWWNWFIRKHSSKKD